MRKSKMQRRTFLKTSSLACMSGYVKPARLRNNEDGKIRPVICLNAYSFNRLLLDGKMSLEELFRYAAETGFAGVDLTAYYIPGYPDVPEDEVLFNIKRMAFRHGLAVTGTGVRNDFTLADPEKRAAEIALVKNWIIAAAKLGAPHVRVFSGRQSPPGHSREEIKSWIIESFQECADFASSYGVMIGFQNHDDFIVTTEDILDILQGVDSGWFGLMLDIGSLPTADPYAEIEKLIPYAITWQVKENLKTGMGSIPTDFGKLMKMVDESNYQGFFPIETLGEGDPYVKVKALYKHVSDSMI
ncbi:sugar phosphate isomerase/epimerase family protein [Bacteroidota bacterium]